MKTIRVVAAVICDSILEKKKIFATARGYGDMRGGSCEMADERGDEFGGMAVGGCYVG